MRELPSARIANENPLASKFSRPHRLRAAVFNDTRPERHYGCTLVMSQLLAGLRDHSIEPVWFHTVGTDWHEDKQIASELVGVDLVIVNGEGTIHHTATRARARMLTEVGPFARNVLGVPAFLINATISDIDPAASEALRCFDRIFVRESESHDVAAGFGIATTLVPDLTLAATLPSSPARRGICGTDSALAQIASAIAALCHDNHWPFQPMSSRGLGRSTATSPEDYAGFLAQHEAVITGRFHAVTFCLATGTPFIALESNTPKISSFVKDVLGTTRRIVSRRALNSLELDAYRSWSADEQVRLAAFIPRARSEICAMFSNIAGAVRRAAPASKI